MVNSSNVSFMVPIILRRCIFTLLTACGLPQSTEMWRVLWDKFPLDVSCEAKFRYGTLSNLALKELIELTIGTKKNYTMIISYQSWVASSSYKAAINACTHTDCMQVYTLQQ